jgi:alcohol dehydrogenase
MQTFDFSPSTRVIFGQNSFEQLGGLVKSSGARRVLVVSDPGIRSAGYTQKAIELIRKESLETFVFEEVAENPTSEDVERGAQFAQLHQPDLIVGLGGGSAMDLAKGINFVLTNGGQMEDYWGRDKATKPMLPSIGIPTTAGTGSEAQSFALIEQADTHRKMACGDMKARFRLVILDPVLTTTMPRSVTAISGIDAITHAVESFVCTARNPMSQMFAREAWQLLESNYECVLNNPSDVEARAAMLLGSHFAGMSIELSMLGAAHACANPLSMYFHVAHGVAVGLMLPAVIEFNAAVANDLYNELVPGGAEELSCRIHVLKEAGQLPSKLRDCGVTRESIPSLAKEADQQWTGKYNPHPMTEQDFVHLYESTY